MEKQIIKFVCYRFGVNSVTFNKDNRNEYSITARQTCAYLLFEHGFRYKDIKLLLGYNDNGSVNSSIRKIRELDEHSIYYKIVRRTCTDCINMNLVLKRDIKTQLDLYSEDNTDEVITNIINLFTKYYEEAKTC